MKRAVSSVKALFLLSNIVAFAGVAQAAGDMLQPNEIQRTGISDNPANDTGPYVGGNLTFGQARTTEENASGGLGMLASFEPGYQVNRGSWSRVELSGQAFTGSLGFRASDAGGKVTMPIGFGLLAKVGYGYSIGQHAFGIARIGVGPVQARWKGDDVDPEGAKVSGESTSALNGLATQIAWDVVAPLGESNFDAVFGISWTHFQFDLGKVKAGGVTGSVDRPVLVNLPAAQLGLRVRL